MTRLLALALLFVAVAPLRAQQADSTDLLFDDSVMHDFTLTFYVDGWEDSLRWNYEHGELYMPARVEYGGVVFDSVGVRYKGNSSYVQSRSTPKKPLKFKFDEYRSKQTFYGVKRLNFSNAVKDPTFMREKLAYDILGTLLPAPRAAYARVTVNGTPLGLYTMVEQLDKVFLKRHFSDNGFNLYKAADNGATLEYRGEEKDAYKTEYELETNESKDNWSRFITLLAALQNTSRESFVEELGAQLDFDRAISVLAFNMAVSNFDSYTGSGRNFYLYDDEASGRFSLLPWDPNEAFGAYANNWNVVTQDVVAIPNLAKRPLTRRIFENDSLRHVYLARIRSIIEGPASVDSMIARTSRLKAFLDAAVQADIHKLYTYQQFVENIEHEVYVGIGLPVPGLIDFARARTTRVLEQLSVHDNVYENGPFPSQPIPLVWNYPNPFATSTTLKFHLLRGGEVTVLIHSMLGEEVLRFDAGVLPAGVREVSMSGTGLAAGVYSARILLAHPTGGAYASATHALLIVK